LDIINDSDYGLGLGSLDSSDMFPTQGSLCGLERLALETMGPAGSMSNMTNSVYINPFPPRHSQESLALRDRQQTVSRPRTSQLRNAAWSGSVSLVDSNTCHDSPPSESSFIETQRRSQKRSASHAERIVGALNQGIASLGEKIVQEKSYSILE